MRLLLDNNLSPRLVDLLTQEGWDVVHVRTLGLRADTDFGALLATTHDPGPSVVLVRRVASRRVDDLADILVANLPQVEDDLRAGSIVVMGDDSLRIRRL